MSYTLCLGNAFPSFRDPRHSQLTLGPNNQPRHTLIAFTPDTGSSVDTDANDDRSVVVRHEDLHEAGKDRRGIFTIHTNVNTHGIICACYLPPGACRHVMSLCEHHL